MNQVTNIGSSDSGWKSLYKPGGMAAMILFILFLIGITGSLPAGSPSTTPGDLLMSIQDNWLMVLFKLNAGFDGMGPDSLNMFNLVDIVIMVLCGALYSALYAALRRASKIWSAIAASLPFLGIVVFLITNTAGRSGSLIGGMIFSTIMLRSSIFSKVSAYVGAAASALLFFAGDIGTAIFVPSNVIALLIAIGYVLWMIWLFLVGRRLFQPVCLESRDDPESAG